MATTTRTIVVYTCDGCGARKNAVSMDFADRPEGIFGTVDPLPHIDPDAPDAEWYAHSARCVGKAVAAVLDAAERRAAGDVPTEDKAPAK